VLKPPVVRAEVAASSTGVTSPLVEEGWGLLSKFYVDKTFNGQDWDAARTAANDKALKKGEFRALDDLTKSLGDKYTRVVTKDSYSKLARFDLVGAGVLFAPNDAGHMSIASPPMPGSSGFAAGLHKGDLVLSINGLPTDGMTSFDVIVSFFFFPLSPAYTQVNDSFSQF
jgi:C-terminal processing protease CtpA/Prc